MTCGRYGQRSSRDLRSLSARSLQPVPPRGGANTLQAWRPRRSPCDASRRGARSRPNRTLLAVEGAEPRDTTSVGATIDALNRAAALRERQPQAADVGELLCEARDELERRLEGYLHAVRCVPTAETGAGKIA